MENTIASLEEPTCSLRFVERLESQNIFDDFGAFGSPIRRKKILQQQFKVVQHKISGETSLEFIWKDVPIEEE